MLSDFLLVFLGGGTGACARFGVTRLSARLFGNAFPWGTLAVNLAGCLLIGMSAGLLERDILPMRARPLFIVGFLGGLTTFSSYAFDTFELFRRAEWGRALANIALDNILGLVLAATGYIIVARR
jgi:CrcB protein